MAKRFVHDPDCARTRDAAPTADWDAPDYKPPSCTCKERQDNRRRITAMTGGSGVRGVYEGQSLGGGNYVTLPHKAYG